MSQYAVVRFRLDDDIEPEDFVDLLRSLGLDCVRLVNDGFGHLLPPGIADDPLPEDDHEAEHELERRGGERVDRRVCQGIGCPYGDTDRYPV